MLGPDDFHLPRVNDALVPVGRMIRAGHHDATHAGDERMAVDALGHVNVGPLIHVALAFAGDAQIGWPVVTQMDHRIDGLEKRA